MPARINACSRFCSATSQPAVIRLLVRHGHESMVPPPRHKAGPLVRATRYSTTAEPKISRKKYSSGLPSFQSSRARSSHSLPALTATRTAPVAPVVLEMFLQARRS